MQQKSIGSQIWRFAGPLVIQYLISIAVGTGISMIIMMQKMPELLTQAAQNADMTKMAEAIAGQVMQYTTEAAAAAALITIPVMLFMFRKDRKKEIHVNTAVSNAKGWQYLLIVILGAGACLALNNLITMSTIAFYSDSYQQVSEGFYSAQFAVQLLGLGILTPIAEELVFRGLLYRRMRERMPARRCVIWSGVIFGLYHGNMVQAIYGLILGMLLAYLYEKFGSLKAPILGHITVNLCSVLFTHFKLFDWTFQSPIRLGIVTIVSAAVAACGFVCIQKIESRGLAEAEIPSGE